MKQNSYNEWKWLNLRKTAYNHLSLMYCSAIIHSTDPDFFHFHIYPLATQCLEFVLQLEIGIWPLTAVHFIILGADPAQHSFKGVLLMSPVKLPSSSSHLYLICCACRFILASPLCKFFLQCPFTIVKLCLFRH